MSHMKTDGIWWWNVHIMAVRLDSWFTL